MTLVDPRRTTRAPLLLIAAAALLGPACGDDSNVDTGATATTTDATTTDATAATTTAATTDATTTTTTTTTTTDATTATTTATTGETTTGTTDPTTTTTTTTGGADPVIVDGFSHPESALWVASEMRWYISNIGGDPSAKDGDGFISQLSADGTVEAMMWATGLDAPKGSGIAGDRFYVADIDQVRVLDAATGALQNSVPIAGAVFLNDIAVDMMGVVYVSDTGTNTVHRLTGGMMSEVVVTSAELHGPNGLAFAGDRLTIASLGDDQGMGALFRLMGMMPLQIGDLQGRLDGVIARKDDYLVTDFDGLLYRAPADGGPVELLRDLAAEDGFMSSADLGYARTLGVAAIPDLLGDKVGFFVIE